MRPTEHSNNTARDLMPFATQDERFLLEMSKVISTITGDETSAFFAEGQTAVLTYRMSATHTSQQSSLYVMLVTAALTKTAPANCTCGSAESSSLGSNPPSRSSAAMGKHTPACLLLELLLGSFRRWRSSWRLSSLRSSRLSLRLSGCGSLWRRSLSRLPSPLRPLPRLSLSRESSWR